MSRRFNCIRKLSFLANCFDRDIQRAGAYKNYYPWPQNTVLILKVFCFWLSLFSDGDKWKKRRKLITPTFHFRILNDFIQVCEEQTAILVSRLKVTSVNKIG